MSSVSVLVLTLGRERPTLRRALESTLKHAGLRAGDEVVVGNVGPDHAVSGSVAWAAGAGWSAAAVREVPLHFGARDARGLQAVGGEGPARNALAEAAAGDLLVWLDDTDMLFGNAAELLRQASDETPDRAVTAWRKDRAGNADRLVVARRDRRGDWRSPAGYLEDTVARHGGQRRDLQAVVYMIRPFPERW